MDTVLDCTVYVSQQEQPISSRGVATQALGQFDQLDSPWTTVSQVARELGVPDSTLRYWRQKRWMRIANSCWPPQVVRFLESPDGLAFLHQLLAAAHLVFVQANDCGIRNLCWFLKISGLDEFIAPSYGAQQAVAQQLESLLIAFGEEEDQRLAAQMPPREISVAEDETFHPEICLVGIEPVSNFILIEQYQPQRDADTWSRCLNEKLASLPITVCQVVSDQAKALINHAEQHLGVHHSPDLFHVQHDTVRATSLALAGQTLEEDEVARRLAGHFDTLQQVAAEAGLSSRAVEKLAKARRVLDAMNATIAFFWKMIGVWFSCWNLPEPVQQWMREELIPGYYLARVAKKASKAAERLRLRELSNKILARARSPDGVWGTLSPDVRVDLEQKAQTCADLFQRSSSCVEGRNGHLSLKHHALHQLSSRKLQSLTVVHNYSARRTDGTTAAERFYGTAPRDVFAWLLDRLSVPARPRARRHAA